MTDALAFRIFFRASRRSQNCHMCDGLGWTSFHIPSHVYNSKELETSLSNNVGIKNPPYEQRAEGGSLCAKGSSAIEVQAECARTNTGHLIGKYWTFRLMFFGGIRIAYESKMNTFQTHLYQSQELPIHNRLINHLFSIALLFVTAQGQIPSPAQCAAALKRERQRQEKRRGH